MKAYLKFDTLSKMSKEELYESLKMELRLEEIFIDLSVFEEHNLLGDEQNVLIYCLCKNANGTPNRLYFEKAIEKYIEQGGSLEAYYKSCRSYYKNNYDSIMTKMSSKDDPKKYLIDYREIKDGLYKVLYVVTNSKKIHFATGFMESEIDLGVKLYKRIHDILRGKSYYEFSTAEKHFSSDDDFDI